MTHIVGGLRFAHMHYDQATTTTRETTPEGMLRASAIVTRAGLFPYDAGQLGVGSDGTTIMVERPVESLKDPKTLDSIRGAPVTLGHPPEDIGPGNWDRFVVGNVVGEPRVDRTGNVIADILIGRQDAVKMVDLGMAELSIGYNFNHAPAPEDSAATLLTKGPMHINHVAIVPNGRAGPGVRIMDQKDSETMNDTDLAKITAAVKDGLTSAKVQDASLDTAALANAITASLKPTLDSIDAMKKKMMENEDEEKKKKMMMEQKDKADKLIAAAMADGYRKADLIGKATAAGKMTADEAATFRDKSYKEIAVHVLKDSHPHAANMDENYLQGLIDATFAHNAFASRPTIGKAADQMSVPGASGATSKAYDDFVKSFEWKPDAEGDRAA